MKEAALPRAQAERFAAILLPLVAVGLLLVLLQARLPADPTGQQVAALPRVPDATLDLGGSSLEQRLAERVNAVRAQRGLCPVVLVHDLTSVARAHSRDMAHRDRIGHADASGRNAGRRLDEAGVPWLRYGENVGVCCGYSDPCEALIDAWLKSPGHAANLLQPDVQETGVGCVVGPDGSLFVTQVFVKRETR